MVGFKAQNNFAGSHVLPRLFRGNTGSLLAQPCLRTELEDQSPEPTFQFLAFYPPDIYSLRQYAGLIKICQTRSARCSAKAELCHRDCFICFHGRELTNHQRDPGYLPRLHREARNVSTLPNHLLVLRRSLIGSSSFHAQQAIDYGN